MNLAKQYKSHCIIAVTDHLHALSNPQRARIFGIPYITWPLEQIAMMDDHEQSGFHCCAAGSLAAKSFLGKTRHVLCCRDQG